MTQAFLWIYDRFKAHRWLAALLWVVILLSSVILMFHIRLKEDISDFLSNDEESQRYMAIFQQIGSQDRIVIITSAPDIPDTDRADSIMTAMDEFSTLFEEADTARTIPAINMQVDENAIAGMMDFVMENAPLLMQEKDYERIDSLLEQPDYVAHALEEDRQTLLLPTGSLMTEQIRHDPLHLFSPIFLRLKDLQDKKDYQVENGYIFTQDHKAGIGFLTSPYGANESARNRELGKMLDNVCQQVMQRHPCIHMSTIGGPLIAVSNAERIKADGLIAGGLSLFLITLILFAVFRRLSDILWIVVSIATGYAIAIAVIGLYRSEISIIVMGISSVIIGIAANYPLHFLDHLRHESNHRQALRDMIPPLLTGNITTVSAFACLAWMDSSAMKDLGIIGALVLIGTILFVLVFLPLFAAKRKAIPCQEETIEHSVGRWQRIFRSGWTFLLILLLTGVFAILSTRTSFDTNMQHINYMTDVQRENLGLLNIGLETVSGKNILAVTEAEHMEDALVSNELLVDSLQQAGLRVKNIGDFLPSRQRQEKALKRWKDFQDKHGEHIRKQLSDQLPRFGFSAHAFSPFMEMLENVPHVQDITYFAPLTTVIGDQFITSDLNKQHNYLVNYIQTDDAIDKATKENWRKRFGHLAAIFDSSDVQETLTSTLSDNFNYIGLVCGFVVFFFLWFSFGSIELSLLSFIPLAVSWVWILGLMQLTGIQFNIVNIILATFIFGQGDDYTIFITEGLIYEHTYGKRILRSYRNSVILSAIIMFIGIGTLILAKHPAMRSLAEVVIVGMFTVVVMANYLPPVLFRWATTEHGELRQVPLTMQRFLYSTGAFLLFLIASIPYQLFAFLYSHIGKYTEAKREFFHRTLRTISDFSINHVPGTRYKAYNPYNETLQKPAIIISNHQSQLDLMAVLSIAPKVVILTKKWVWNNPFYGLIIRAAEFYPVSDGVEKSEKHIADLLSRGYSVVVFPEGTRSKDGQIHRFHQGAFHMAKKYGVDILPVFLHGLNHVLPKGELSLRKGNMCMEIGKRITPEDAVWQMSVREQTKYFHQYYVENFEKLSRREEKTECVLPYVEYQYKYKGATVEREARRQCKKILREAQEIDNWQGGTERIMESCGQGERAFVFALVHPEVQVTARDTDPEKIAIAQHINIKLPNLRFEVLEET